MNGERMVREVIDYSEDREINEETGIGSDGWNRTNDLGVMKMNPPFFAVGPHRRIPIKMRVCSPCSMFE
jgi:hypothetical protein